VPVAIAPYAAQPSTAAIVADRRLPDDNSCWPGRIMAKINAINGVITLTRGFCTSLMRPIFTVLLSGGGALVCVVDVISAAHTDDADPRLRQLQTSH